ncbi:glycosyltransferase [Desulfobacula sp.]|uniref:glycosyltransferase family protein n=1 Tax=Desulfobacula sp. TaxID=2593537 RepID=UPI00260AB4E7|nr:glycosyltransferase [Desulfobacula sp.]
MKILIYCQHVLGVGHFFRTLEIARAMAAFDVVLVTGGDKVDVILPAHIRQVHLPGLMMDEAFTGLHSVNPEIPVEAVKLERQKALLDLIKTERPDVFFIELYPFGRRAFRFELIPALAFIRHHLGKTCKVVCSLRDILVEKKDSLKYETRVIEALNSWFDAVLVHSDPQLIKLSASFSRLDKIKIPLVYTGFVTPVPDPEQVGRIRQEMGVTGKDRLIVASAGGGNVGAPLLRAVVNAYKELSSTEDVMLKVCTGPYMAAEDKAYLRSFAGKNIHIEEFTREFVSLLGASDLSISMAGYNTCMNIVAARVPSLVWPFRQNREQRERALNLARFVPMTLLEDQDLTPLRLSQLMETKNDRQPQKTIPHPNLNIHGALNTMEWIREQRLF